MGTGDQRDHWGGGQAWQTPRNSWKTKRNYIRTHQECPEVTQEAPQMPHDLAEPLFKPLRQHSFAPTPRARPSPGALILFQTLATGSRTQEPFRFPGLDSPPNLRHIYIYICTIIIYNVFFYYRNSIIDDYGKITLHCL